MFINISRASSSPHVNTEEALTSRRTVVKYDVFINHRGSDVKDTIASHIYDLLDRCGVPAFLDREELETGDDFPAAIRNAISSSTVHIAIFSPRYAESSWCLRELALMVQSPGATISPVFWNVTPQEIRWAKKGNVAKAFRKHYKKYPPQTVDEWKTALNHVSDISGLSFSEFKGRLSSKVVDEVMKKLSSTETLSVAKFPIGLEKHRILLGKLLGYNFEVSNSSHGEQLLKNKLIGADALIVYDNIENGYQMDGILFEDVLNPGSTVIVTTRDQSICKRWNNNYLKYELSELNFCESKELFCRHAFRSDRPLAASFESLLDQFVKMCKGLPLALEVCGGQLYNESYPFWKSFLKKVSQKMLPELQSILQVSYEQLDDIQKEIFLDIAIFFHGQNHQTITRIWEEEADFSCDLRILERKCMIKLHSDRVGMDDLLRELGRAIVYEKCPKDPGRRSHLWHPSDVKEVLKNFTGTESVRGLSLVSGETVLWNEDEFGNRCAWTTDSFANMKGLQILELKDDCLKGDFGKLSQKLLPLTLRELNMQNCHFINRVPESMSKLTGLQEVDFSDCTFLKTIPEEFCYLQSLEVLKLNYCRNLEYLPLGFGGMKRLQSLELESCTKLKELPESFGQLPQLQFLQMRRCENVEIAEGSFGNISTLREVILTDCGKMEMVPSSLSRQRSMEVLHLGTRLKTCHAHSRVGPYNGFLPNDVGDLSELRELILSTIKNLKELPQSIGKLSNVTSLILSSISNCPNLNGLPASTGNLMHMKSLTLSELPKVEGSAAAFIAKLSNLTHLVLSGVPLLERLPPSFHNLSCLFSFQLNYYPRVKELNLSNHKILRLHDIKGLNLLKVHVSEAFYRRNYLWLENLPPINDICFTASAIPVTAIIDPSWMEAIIDPSGQSLGLLPPPTGKTCTAIIICFVSVLHIGKFDKQFLPPRLAFTACAYQSFGERINFTVQSKIGELIHFTILETIKGGRGSPQSRNQCTRGTVEVIGQRRQHLPSHAREHAPSQLNLRNVHALDIANCRIRRFLLLYNTPIQVEEMELVYTNKQLFWKNDKMLEHLDLSMVNFKLSSAVKSVANLYKMEVMISSRGNVVYKDKLQEYDIKNALVNRHDEISTQVFRILKSREFLKNELKSKRKVRGKKRKNELKAKGNTRSLKRRLNG
eukprot:Gb_26063 [translate_table: standard]